MVNLLPFCIWGIVWLYRMKIQIIYCILLVDIVRQVKFRDDIHIFSRMERESVENILHKDREGKRGGIFPVSLASHIGELENPM